MESSASSISTRIKALKGASWKEKIQEAKNLGYKIENKEQSTFEEMTLDIMYLFYTDYPREAFKILEKLEETWKGGNLLF